MGLIEQAAPFSRNLLDTPYTKNNPVIRRLEGLTGKIIRADDFEYSEDPDLKDLLKEMRTEDIEESIQLMDETLTMYRSNGIAMPNFKRAALVRYNGLPVVFTMVDEVIGENIWHGQFTDSEKPTVTRAVDKTYANLIRIADYVFFHGGRILTDVQPDQFVWGNTHGEKNHVYFVDLEPDCSHSVTKFDELQSNEYPGFFLSHMENFTETILLLEERFGKRMSETRREFIAFCDQFDDTAYEHSAQRLLDMLHKYPAS
jgi:hypothetical protein